MEGKVVTLLYLAALVLFGGLVLSCLFIFIKAAVKAGMREYETEKRLEKENIV